MTAFFDKYLCHIFYTKFYNNNITPARQHKFNKKCKMTTRRSIYESKMRLTLFLYGFNSKIGFPRNLAVKWKMLMFCFLMVGITKRFSIWLPGSIWCWCFRKM